ncbi:tetratricopeptide repeat protein [Prochlorococcus marinus]|nr:tetratricopeptide repeat protein [Prochlorococcus marinus]
MNTHFIKKLILLIATLCYLLFFASSLEVRATESLKMLFDRGLQESRDGDFLKALDTWEQFLKLSPEDAAALSNRGNVRLLLGDPEGAIVDQKRAINLLPEEIDPYMNKGIAEEVLGKWDEAVKDYELILAREPNNSLALFNLASAKGSQGDWLQAEEFFDKAANVQPGFVLARISKALANYQLKNFDQAESDLRAIIRKYPMFPDSRAALTALLWKRGLVGEAESNWIAVAGLDNRFLDRNWLEDSLRWPPDPLKDLLAFIDLER